MDVLQGMDPDKMIIILPSALVVMYLVISLQNFLCRRSNPHIGLILPAVCFIAATVLAVRPLLVVEEGGAGALLPLCLRMWLTFNIATLVFLFPYYKHYKMRAAAAKMQAEMSAEEPDASAAGTAIGTGDDDTSGSR